MDAKFWDVLVGSTALSYKLVIELILKLSCFQGNHLMKINFFSIRKASMAFHETY